MEFEDVSEKVEWEARRVAAAFGVEEFELSFASDEEQTQIIYVGQSGDKEICWGVNTSTYTADYFRVADDIFNVTLFDFSSVGQDKQWSLSVYPECHHALACGLYRLGFEDEGVLAELNSPLSAHEKLELRLSLPYEFWPQTWLDEEKATGDL